MAQQKNATFQGANFYEVEPRSFTTEEVHGNIVGDLALLQERSSGQGSPTIDHSGNGRGATLGFPVVKQSLFNWLYVPTEGLSEYVWVSPVFVPRGESTIFVEINTDSQMLHTAHVFQTQLLPSTNPVISTIPMSTSRYRYHEAYIGVGGTSGGVVLLAISVDGGAGTIGVADIEQLQMYYAVNAYFKRTPSSSGDLMGDVNRTGSVIPVATEASGGATINKDYPFDEDLFDPDIPIGGHILTRVNREQNGLVEFMTGAPAGTNETVALSDSSATDPARSAFYNHSPQVGGVYENGNYVQMPIYTASGGNLDFLWEGFNIQGSSFPVGPILAGTNPGNIPLGIDIYRYLHTGVFLAPDMLIDTAVSNLKATVAILSTKTNSVDVFCRIFFESESGSVSTVVNSGTSTITSKGLHYFTFTNLRCFADQLNKIYVTIDTSAGYQAATADIPHLSFSGITLYSDT
tara:strand:- start:28347 stop:29732 length:1386 start_codon:yes stop_codon:yes gene_type:complete